VIDGSSPPQPRASHDEVEHLKDAITRATPDEYEYLKEQVA
jgi:hypothetical protein